ncbi:MAG: hypothetical protein WD397_06535 [Wenzhouxiangellaceae bacterium]
MRSLILTIVLALFAFPALAQHTRDYSDQLPDDLPPFEEADKNDDGLIDWEEAEEIGIPREVFDAEQQGGYLAEPTYRYAIRRENP